MALSDSMFLFELNVQNLKSYVRCEKLKIIGQFADVFKLNIKYPKVMHYSKEIRTKNVKQRDKFKKIYSKDNKSKTKVRTHQSTLVSIKPSKLISLMKLYPLEITVNNDCDQYLGSTIISWSEEFINYVSKTNSKSTVPIYAEKEYNVYNEQTTKRILTLNLCLKLCYLKNKTLNHFKAKSKNKEILNTEDKLLNNEILTETSRSLTTLADIRKRENNLSFNTEQLRLKPILLESESYVKSEIIHEQQVCCNKSNLDMAKEHNTVVSTKSLSSIDNKQKNNLFRYIFGDPLGSFGDKVYQVGFFTVENDVSGQTSPHNIHGELSPEVFVDTRRKLEIKKCDSECLRKEDSCQNNISALGLPEELAHPTKCEVTTCDYKNHRDIPLSPDDRILLDLTSQQMDCCKVEERMGGVIAKMKIGPDPCCCTCECGLFSFTKTTYCAICGGYETVGEGEPGQTVTNAAMPCPIYHKLLDKNKLKTWSTSGSESKKKGDDQRSLRSVQRSTEKRSVTAQKKVSESEKGKKKKRDDRFKFNYGYKGIPPQIGHSKCALPCLGTLDNVPKSMGWLWSAENVPGVKFRPLWKPGAINKHVLRLLRIARHPDHVISKKKKKDLGKKKRPLKRPLLVVHKKDGEYTVTMETMKTFSKARALNQNPYEDKPLVTYTVGRTDEENRDRLKKKEREKRRLEMAQKKFIQSTFKDMCKEICLKTYYQALGILPDTEDPLCTCYPALPSAEYTNMDISCSCSEDKSSGAVSDTDSDEWLVEFTPPNATFDPFYKGKKVLREDSGSQYSYLDYRVKLFDRFGNPIPRFFKGPEGKQECSDLGGFWGPDQKWLEINVDGYIAPDGKWAPMNFIGPSGEPVEALNGKFQTMSGKWLLVGIDGFIDSQGKWKYYPKAIDSMKKKHGGVSGKKMMTVNKVQKTVLKSEGSWSCFGDVSPRHLSKLGIVGHGEDRKLLLIKLQNMLQRGEDVKIPQPSTVYRLQPSKNARRAVNRIKFSRSFQEQYKCHHSVPSAKGIIAVNDHGNKTYFSLKNHVNRRPNQRIATLTNQGISLSSFHVPCFHSFINSEVMKQQLRDKINNLSKRNIETQY